MTQLGAVESLIVGEFQTLQANQRTLERAYVINQWCVRVPREPTI